MSYILDALSKADERRQDAVPNIYAHANVPDPLMRRRRRGMHPGWLWALAALVAATCITALWFMLSSQRAAPVAAPAAAPAVTATAAVSTVAAPPAAPPPVVASAAAVAPVPTVASAPVAVASLPAASAIVPQPAVSAAPVLSATAASDAPRKAAEAAKPTPPKPAPSKPAAVLPTYAKLSSAERSGMPALSVGGSVYSPQPSARLLMLNGLVLREGDRVVAGLTVESIGVKSSTLNWRGTRFQLPH